MKLIKKSQKTIYSAPTPLRPSISAINANSRIIGSWIDKSNGNIHIIYKENGEYYWTSRYFNGNEATDELVLIKKMDTTGSIKKILIVKMNIILSITVFCRSM